VIAHALCVIGNKRLGKSYDSNKIALLGVFHDAGEIITGDMPTPIKYANNELKQAYKSVEKSAAQTLLEKLPEDLKEDYAYLFLEEHIDNEEKIILKAADKISALIKCQEEENSGNKEFIKAKEATLQSINKMDCKEANIFLEEFFQGFTKTLDEL
ncbi:MAG: 5'-deoxynucleotidase, partial [Oscillospiraceae bacterium]